MSKNVYHIILMQIVGFNASRLNLNNNYNFNNCNILKHIKQNKKNELQTLCNWDDDYGGGSGGGFGHSGSGGSGSGGN